MVSESLASATRTLPASSASLERALERSAVALATSLRKGESTWSAMLELEDLKAALSSRPSWAPLLRPAPLKALEKDEDADEPEALTSLSTAERNPAIVGNMEMCAEPTCDPWLPAIRASLDHPSPEKTGAMRLLAAAASPGVALKASRARTSRSLRIG